MLNFLMKKILTINIAEKDIEFFFSRNKMWEFFIAKKDDESVFCGKRCKT